MSDNSSDFEDDCYGNVAKKLDFMKTLYVEDKLSTSTLLEDCLDKEKEIVSNDITVESETKSEGTINTTNSRRLRSNTSVSKPPKPVKEKSAKETNKAPKSRSRKRRASTPRRHNPVSEIPTISIGNTFDYPDNSETQQLFSTKNKEDNEILILDDDDPLDENEEMSVKVCWRSCDYFRFSIRKFQKLTQIYDYFAKKESVSHDHLLFIYNEKFIKPDDTPNSIGYNIAKFIDGGVVNRKVNHSSGAHKNNEGKDGVTVKFQVQNVKKPIEIEVILSQRLYIPMIKCAEAVEKPLEKLKFMFDGEVLSSKSTPLDLDFEGGECIDVKILD